MGGRAGSADQSGRYDRVVYLPCTAENNFQPRIPDRPVDLIYLCFPEQPDGGRADARGAQDVGRLRPRAERRHPVRRGVRGVHPRPGSSALDLRDRGRARDRDRVPLLLQDRRVHRHALRLHRRAEGAAGALGVGRGGEPQCPVGPAAIHQVQRRGVRDPARRGCDLHGRGPPAGEGARGPLHGQRPDHPRGPRDGGPHRVRRPERAVHLGEDAGRSSRRGTSSTSCCARPTSSERPARASGRAARATSA